MIILQTKTTDKYEINTTNNQNSQKQVAEVIFTDPSFPLPFLVPQKLKS